METNNDCTHVACTPQGKSQARPVIPAVDIGETEDEFVVVADLPGSSREAIDIDLEKNVLTIRAQAVGSEAPSSLLLQEFRRTGFERRFQIGKLVDAEKVSAEYSDGVLTVRLPKAAAAKPRKIPLAS